ncbi:hypothetical protein HERIO_2765 [Hepatospora eriocheir]|uniref:Lipoprotein n=1 Tax=Hepatospora eriocheir TaxID=1081669 RepID=A0A1X0QAE9_9MICR|nr:hypothetical protein HERIO_2765 [Hepatospora eriocheir]
MKFKTVYLVFFMVLFESCLSLKEVSLINFLEISIDLLFSSSCSPILNSSS